jgi:serpin B
MNLIDGNNKFALDVYRSLSKDKTENVFFSPMSISFALAMAYAGARGETREQMADAMHFDLPNNQLHLAFSELRRSIEDIDESKVYGDGQVFKMNLANSIWCQKGYAFKSDYINLLINYYSSGLKLVDFNRSPEECRREINDWVSRKTEEKIQNLIPPGGVDRLTRLILANAVYFYAGWEIPFWKNSTQDGDFSLLNGEKVNVSMMNMVERIGYLKRRGFQAVSLPYVGERFSMQIILPNIQRFEEFERKLDSKLINRIHSRAKTVKVDLTMPKFSFDSTLSLLDTLVSLGMKDAFSDKADFSGMEDTKELYIHDVYHKAYISVDEKGTEAAAATAGPMVAVAYMPGMRERVYQFKCLPIQIIPPFHFLYLLLYHLIYHFPGKNPGSEII